MLDFVHLGYPLAKEISIATAHVSGAIVTAGGEPVHCGVRLAPFIKEPIRVPNSSPNCSSSMRANGEQLQPFVNRHNLPQRLVQRASMVSLADQGRNRGV